MSPRQSSSLPEVPANLTTIIIAIVGLLTTAITAFFAFQASLRPVELSISATMTAEARLAQMNVTPAIECIGYERIQDWDGAAGCYKQKIIVAPNDFASYKNLNRVYSAQGNYDSALAIANEMLGIATSSEETADAYLQIGLIYRTQDNVSAAIDNFNAGLSVLPVGAPLEPTLSLWLGWSYEVNGQLDEACAAFRRALDAATPLGDDTSSQYALDSLTSCP